MSHPMEMGARKDGRNELAMRFNVHFNFHFHFHLHFQCCASVSAGAGHLAALRALDRTKRCEKLEPHLLSGRQLARADGELAIGQQRARKFNLVLTLGRRRAPVLI